MKAYGLAGLCLLSVAEIGMYYRIEPFHSWFYSFAWWSYILLADNLLLKFSGSSLLTTRRRELWRMLPLSVFVWLVFESYNLGIRNWGYTGVPSENWLRWPGYALAFATVFPGIFITSDLVDRVVCRRKAGPETSESEELHGRPTPYEALFVAMGVVLSILPLIWPRYFFPAVWLGPIFLLDPVLHRFGIEGLLSQAMRGKYSRVVSLMTGGFLCGIMWEFWNFWAGSKWVYSVPFFDEWKLFEMPVLGFFGFPPFALECWILYHLLRASLTRCGAPVRAALWAGMLVFSLVMFRAIDVNTVIRFAGLAHGGA